MHPGGIPSKTRTPTMKPIFHKALCLASALPCLTASADWPQWRGPNRDGAVTETSRTLTALPSATTPIWRLDVGQGQASPVIAGKTLVYLDEQNKQEVANAVDITTGKKLWSVPFAESVDFKNTYGPGPRCTPMIDGDKAYVQSCNGEFSCLSLKDGKTVWKTSFAKDFGATFFLNQNDPAAKETAARRHGNNGSGVIDGNRLFLPVGSPEGGALVCFDKNTGKVLWKAGQDNAAYASLVVATLSGVKQVIWFSADALLGADVATGKVLWRVPLKSGAKRHIVTPIIDGDTVTVASHSIGLIKFRISKGPNGLQATEEWKNPALKINIATPVLVNGHLYGLGPGSKTEFLCIDFKTGVVKWNQPGFGDYASVMAFQDKLLVMSDAGELRLLKADPTKYDELGRLQACGKTWSYPAYTDGKLYVRDGAKLFAVELVK
jgi:outer membrane protein assembly factor BamB